jgi:hypothetical protein
VQPLLSPIVGEPVDEVDYILLYNLLNGRRVQAKDKLYELNVRSILRGEVLTINLVAETDSPGVTD